jgi:hypothetical protein
MNSSTYSVITIGYKSLNNIINRVNECYDGPNPPNEFILIINYYSEESYKILEYAKNESRITRYVFCSQNIGFAKAINIGYKLCQSENFIILNDDCSINQSSLTGLIDLLNEKDIGISSILKGSHPNDSQPTPQGFILGIKTEIIDKIGGYVYDEIASPLGCERELTYRANYFGYKVKFNNSLYFRHVHDISLNPTTMINYMGKLMSPLGENAFQYKTIELLENKINFYKKIND